MQEIVDMIYSEDINLLITNMFVFVFCVDCIFNFAALIKTMGKGVR